MNISVCIKIVCVRNNINFSLILKAVPKPSCLGSISVQKAGTIRENLLRYYELNGNLLPSEYFPHYIKRFTPRVTPLEESLVHPIQRDSLVFFSQKAP